MQSYSLVWPHEQGTQNGLGYISHLIEHSVKNKKKSKMIKNILENANKNKKY